MNQGSSVRLNYAPSMVSWVVARSWNGAKSDKMKDLVELKEKIAHAVEIYNNQRPHMSCHLLTPNQMHQQQELKIVTWRKKVEEKSTKNE